MKIIINNNNLLYQIKILDIVARFDTISYHIIKYKILSYDTISNATKYMIQYRNTKIKIVSS